MPVIKSARKKLKQDKKRYLINLRAKREVKEKIKKFKNSPSIKMLSELYSVLDKAAKKNIFHPNKSARYKSRLSKLVKEKITSV